MALTVNHPTLKEQTVKVYCPSIGGTPATAYMRMPFRGKIVKIGAVTQGAITTADCSVAISNTTQSLTPGGSPLVIPVASAAAGQLATMTPTSNNTVNEDDIVSFTPSGASGSSIACNFFAVVQAG